MGPQLFSRSRTGLRIVREAQPCPVFIVKELQHAPSSLQSPVDYLSAKFSFGSVIRKRKIFSSTVTKVNIEFADFFFGNWSFILFLSADQC